jgi:phytoene dehydrogenase-like protein
VADSSASEERLMAVLKGCRTRRACVVGAGPNGLAAAIVLAQAGLKVDVFEAKAEPGGAARTLELTLPGFHHDFGSAVHPMAVGSPFFSSLNLKKYGLEWVYSPAALAHPLDDGTAVALESDFGTLGASLGTDANAWRSLFQPYVRRWSEFVREVMRPVRLLPKNPLLVARFGARAFLPANILARAQFKTERARSLFAGIAAHSFLGLDEPFSSASGMLLGAAAHAVGWPIPRGGAKSITHALCTCLAELGGSVTTGTRVQRLSNLGEYDITLCDVTPGQLVLIADGKLSESYREKLKKFPLGPGVFKVDYALSAPIPWSAQECSRAATVHIGGSLDEIAESEKSMRKGQHAERPFVLLAQPTLFDSTRAPAGKHIAWAYCHVPNGSTFDMLGRIEDQIERFAPGFRDCILARRVLSPAVLESMDENLIGGDISGGAMDLRHFIFRPTWHSYSTSARDIYLCSSSTPPGGGVHGMCGYHAAKLALSRIGKDSRR